MAVMPAVAKAVVKAVERMVVMTVAALRAAVQTAAAVRAEERKAVALEEVAAAIAFHDVRFTYPRRPDVPVLRGLTLDVPAGATVALVGESGSGKSTVVGLIERFYDPEAGTITLDGAPLASLNVAWLRAQIGVVMQEPTLFEGSILENVRYGRSNATENEVRAALTAANADGFVSALPQGLATAVGGTGTALSGGQKQRVAIARALVRRPKVLIFDEATSALDSRSQEEVQAAVNKVLAESRATCLLIAHRLSTVAGADKIVVLDQGALVEEGTHEELMAKGGAYTKMNAGAAH